MREIETGRVAASAVEFRPEGRTVPLGAHSHKDEDFRIHGHLNQGNVSVDAKPVDDAISSFISSRSAVEPALGADSSTTVMGPISRQH
eukprot:5767220-Pyramimonas_sp.AAC.1